LGFFRKKEENPSIRVKEKKGLGFLLLKGSCLKEEETRNPLLAFPTHVQGRKGGIG